MAGEMAREMAERLLAALRRAEQLYSADPGATGDVPGAPSGPARPRSAEDGE